MNLVFRVLVVERPVDGPADVMAEVAVAAGVAAVEDGVVEDGVVVLRVTRGCLLIFW